MPLDCQLITVQGDAIAEYSHLFRRSEGLYLAYSNQESMEDDFLEQIKGRDIDLMVCTDSEAILGIGDQGVGVNLYISLSDAVHEQSTSLGHWGIPSHSFLQPGLTILLTRSQLRNLLSTREQAQPCVGDFDQNSF